MSWEQAWPEHIHHINSLLYKCPTCKSPFKVRDQEAPWVSFCGCSDPLSHIGQSSNHHTLLGPLLMTCNQNILFLLLPGPYLMGDFLSNFPAVLWNLSSAVFSWQHSQETERYTSAALDKYYFWDKNTAVKRNKTWHELLPTQIWFFFACL